MTGKSRFLASAVFPASASSPPPFLCPAVRRPVSVGREPLRRAGPRMVPSAKTGASPEKGEMDGGFSLSPDLWFSFPVGRPRGVKISPLLRFRLDCLQGKRRGPTRCAGTLLVALPGGVLGVCLKLRRFGRLAPCRLWTPFPLFVWSFWLFS